MQEIPMMRTGIPLLPSQLTAAQALYVQLSQWNATNHALTALKNRFPDFDLESTLLKVAAINQLYGTNVYAVVRMAEHASNVMTTTAHSLADVVLVERIAALPSIPGQSRDRKHISFSSKFAHFFIDAERFPIYDSYAVKMVEYHLGASERTRDLENPYCAFTKNLSLLKQRDQILCSNQELDNYLWLAGLYWETWRTMKPQINAEVARLFASSLPTVVKNLALLLPGELVQALRSKLAAGPLADGALRWRDVADEWA
jgi:hypothetical protein